MKYLSAACAGLVLLLRAGSVEARPHVFQQALVAAAEEGKLPVAVLDALVEHESRWRPSVEGGLNGRCIGLTQICLHTVQACLGPGGYAAPGCLAVKNFLLDGPSNLRVAGKRLAAWHSLCLKRTGRARPEHLLSGFGGYDARHGLVCGQRHVRGPGGRWRWVDAQVPGVKEILALVKRRGAK